MKNVDNDNKSIVRFFLNAILLFILATLFYKVWVGTYNHYLRFQYQNRGNYFMAILYAMIFILFDTIYGGRKIGESKINNIIISLCLSAIFTNVLSYLSLIVPSAALGFLDPTEMIILTFKEFIVILIWTIIANYIMTKYFPPNDLLLIYGDLYQDKLFTKFIKKKEIYNIVETVSANNDLSILKELIGKYNNIVIGDIESSKRNMLVKYCFGKSKSIFVLPKISDIIIKYSSDLYLLDSPLFVAKNAGISFEKEVIKRFFDVFFSAFALIILSPFMIIIALIIKITDGGKVFFVQDRITKDGKVFKIIKFRSMSENNDCVVKPTEINDDRVTNIGKIIRTTHFDETPQFFNILIGDMSIVGPRPERIEHVNLFSKDIEEFNFRLKVKAGLTGLAQVHGKYNTTAYDKLKLDLIYIQNYSLILDFEIILQTIKTLFFKDNTEGFEKKDSNYISENA